MKGPLIAGLLVLAMIAFIGWFSWVGMRNPSQLHANAVLLAAVAIFAALLTRAWGHSAGDAIQMAIIMPLGVGSALLYVELRSKLW